jgi:hypothetical protein
MTTSSKDIFYSVLLASLFFFFITFSTDYGKAINNTDFSVSLSVSELANSGDALRRPSILGSKGSANEENIAKWLMRFKAYSVEADEHIVIMALARIKPSQGLLDPGFYQYGGSFIYPLGIFYYVLKEIGVLNISSLQNMLNSPDVFDDVYKYGRIFVAFFVSLSSVLLFLSLRYFTSSRNSLIYTAVFLLMPATIMFAQVMKPHYYALFWSNLALYIAIKSIMSGSISRVYSLIIGFSVGMSVGSSLVFSIFAILLWAIVLFFKDLNGRLESIFVIPVVSVITFLLFNPYLLLNFNEASHEANALQGWFDFSVNNITSNLFLYIKNSFSIGFGFAFTIAYLFLMVQLAYKKKIHLKIIAGTMLAVLILMSIITSSLSGWHINARYSPYLAPMVLIIIAYFFKGKKTTLPLLILLFTMIQSFPLYTAYLDEDSLQHSTRLNAANWIDSNIPYNSFICTSGSSIAPYDTPPFKFGKYKINQNLCEYFISVDRQSDNVNTPKRYRLIKRYKPRYNLTSIPLVYSHINPQISIYKVSDDE